MIKTYSNFPEEMTKYLNEVGPSFLRKNRNQKNSIKVHNKILKKLYFLKIPMSLISVRFGINIELLSEYYSGQATKNYEHNGSMYRRCSICGVYMEKESNYYVHNNKSRGRKHYSSSCKKCEKKLNNNKRLLRYNLGNSEVENKSSRKTWGKNKSRYRTRKKVLQIIGYLDGNCAIIKPGNGRKRMPKFFPNG